MLDNGFSLAGVEVLNWGNFHGYQKLSLYEPGDGGPLLRSHPASAILGINGSGKSTLIDALMIVLLPFEGSLKLGVTNDVEAGTGGGRTIRDYVLGKHSSQGGVIVDPAAIFGRKEGCSFVVLHFVHNRHPDRHLTLGRGWWYQNYKVSDTQVAFSSHRRVSVADLCALGKTPPTAKAFRQHVKAALPAVQVFETMQSFFTSVSQSLGHISRDDLKILNRTFFVKSISNIDLFIRENMLIEQESPNLDRLMENVKNGQEIALTIETCEAKIASIGRVLRELNKLSEFSELYKQIGRRARILSLHREWSEWRKLLLQQRDLSVEISAAELKLPFLKKTAEQSQEQWRAAEGRLLTDNIEVQLGTLEQEIKATNENILRKQVTLKRWEGKASESGLKWPKSDKEWTHFWKGLAGVLEDTRIDAEKTAADLERTREDRYKIEASSSERRAELEHIQQSGTLIPRELHLIRENAMNALKVPQGQLMFVGELLQVRHDSRDLRTAVESVLLPISRNLLCHPDHLAGLTRWLDGEGLRADVTVKRISEAEMQDAYSPRPSGLEDGKTCVLDTLEMRPQSEHPFSAYLWRWLKESFAYEVVDVKRFKTEQGRLVTREGLVKKDQRTMRKLKAGFSQSLGWENSERIGQLAQELVQLQAERDRILKLLASQNDIHSRLEDRIRLFVELGERRDEVMGLEEDGKRLRELEQEKQSILKSNPDLREQRLKVERLAAVAERAARALLESESEMLRAQKLRLQVEGLIPSREAELRGSKLHSDLLSELGGESQLESALMEIQESLDSRGISRLQLEGETSDELRRIEHGRSRAISLAAANLGNYRNEFNDPNLPYELGASFDVEFFLSEWSGVDKRLRDTELPGAQQKWRQFFDRVMLDSVKDMINEVKSRVHEIGETVRSINEVLKLTNFEDLANEQRYLRIDAKTSEDERIRRFRKQMLEVEKALSPAIRAQIESYSQEVMRVLSAFVKQFQDDSGYRAFVTDVRNHFQFSVESLQRSPEGEDVLVEVFSGSKKDAKSSAQTTQLAYALLASCLAYRFHFHDPQAGADTPRLIVFDEFGGKFDNEKPREILKLLDKMGFQSVLVSPMSKADLLADGISHLVLVHKVSPSQSKVRSYQLNSKEDYQRLLASAHVG